MPSKSCPKCRAVVPAQHWKKHQRAHQRESRERNGSTRLWRNTRELILARDGHKCTVCGAEATEVDHIDGDWRNNDPRNLRAVCFEHNPRGTQRAKGI
jgi:HNH endonuclease